MKNSAIHEFLIKNRENYIRDLSRLVSVNSVRGDAEPGMPFGKGPAAALREAGKICAEHGFILSDIDRYAGEITMGEDPSLLILAHLDVVPAGNGWTKEPFVPVYADGKLFGRGATDDKGPALAALYAMEAVRDCGVPLDSGVRLVLGCAEETGSEDMKYYFSVRPALRYCFSPDASYPLIHLEKGRYAPYFSISVGKDGGLVSLSGGSTPNIVPDRAEAVVTGLSDSAVSEAAHEVTRETAVRFLLSREKTGLRIQALGTSAHASQPHLGNNAQTALLLLLTRIGLPDSPLLRAIGALVRLFPHGETNGQSLGIYMKDEISGEMTVNFGVLSLRNGILTGCYDSRIPLCGNRDTVCVPADDALRRSGFRVDGGSGMRPAHYVPTDSPLVRTLLSVYEEHTGQRGEALAIGGGTYVHDIEGGVAFGCEMPDTDYRIHGADEFADIDEMLLSAEMFADAIIRLCGKKDGTGSGKSISELSYLHQPEKHPE